MLYAKLVVAIGLLVIGSSVSFVANAVKDMATPDIIRAQGSAIDRETENEAVQMSKAAHVRPVKEVRNRLLQKQQEQEQKRNSAIASYGEWGPVLVAASETYGQDAGSLYRVMMCESKGDSNADNGVNKGLFQFHPGTWAGTPYGGSSIYDGDAQIMAAAWMWSQGRKGEWGCQ